MTSPADSQAPRARGKRGPAASSCDACRRRRIACRRRSGDSNGPCESCEKKGLSCVSGSYGPSRADIVKASGPSTLAGPSSVDSRLADDELAKSLGLELLMLYGDGGSDGRSMALYPLPIFDYASLATRFKTRGGRLSELSRDDQLVCRIIFASAAPHWQSTASATPETRTALSRQLLSAAQESADMLGIWRKPGSTSTKSLLMLQQIMNGGDIASDESLICLSTCVVQIKLLVESAAPKGRSAMLVDGGTAMVWNAGLFDAAASIERKKEPYFSASDYSLMFGYAGKLPSAELLETALFADAWSVTVCALFGLRAYLDVAHRVATLLMGTKSMPQALENEADFEARWRDLDKIYDWGSMAAQLALRGDQGDAFARANLELYCNFAYGPAIAAEFAILQHLEGLDRQGLARAYDLADQISPSLLSTARARFPVRLCRYLRDIRTTDGHNFVAISAGTMISVSRVFAIVRCFLQTSAWDMSLHASPVDKLASLNYLISALDLIAQRYPGTPGLAAVREEAGAERLALVMLTGTSPARLPSDINLLSRPSLGRLNAWTFAHDVSQTAPLLLHQIVDALYKDDPPDAGIDSGTFDQDSFISTEAFASNPWPTADHTLSDLYAGPSALTAEAPGVTVETQALLDLLNDTANPASPSSAFLPTSFPFSAAAAAPPATLDQANEPPFSTAFPSPSFPPAAQNPFGTSTSNGAGNFDWFDAAGDFGAT
uniref:BY PROTMAP: gi/472584225/gb/EMS21831.1/ transcription factor [Rhodosporidium toruloides NP11] gi/647394449/emb/CDR35679.1/ RHTO0S01e04720g1_1 [Rhodosporidium toruloides] n=1 Tax=Rhodotorula toruloides TaxID=5286 RepID=A0A0K3CQI5_RHOTO